jgi:hypothetical protein
VNSHELRRTNNLRKESTTLSLLANNSRPIKNYKKQGDKMNCEHEICYDQQMMIELSYTTQEKHQKLLDIINDKSFNINDADTIKLINDIEKGLTTQSVFLYKMKQADFEDSIPQDMYKSVQRDFVKHILFMRRLQGFINKQILN